MAKITWWVQRRVTLWPGTLLKWCWVKKDFGAADMITKADTGKNIVKISCPGLLHILYSLKTYLVHLSPPEPPGFVILSRPVHPKYAYRGCFNTREGIYSSKAHLGWTGLDKMTKQGVCTVYKGNFRTLVKILSLPFQNLYADDNRVQITRCFQSFPLSGKYFFINPFHCSPRARSAARSVSCCIQS
jgi:hypothetical protein